MNTLSTLGVRARLLQMNTPYPWAFVVAQQQRICLQHRTARFDPWVGKIPRRRAWQPTVVLLPKESHGQRSLVGCRPSGHTESDVTEVTLTAAATFSTTSCSAFVLTVLYLQSQSTPHIPIFLKHLSHHILFCSRPVFPSHRA